MAAWQERFEAFATAMRDPEMDWYQRRLVYEKHIIPLHNSHTNAPPEERAACEQAFYDLWDQQKSAQKSGYFLLPAYAVLVLCNPAHWQSFGETYVPDPPMIRRLRETIEADPSGEANPYWLILRGVLAHILQRDETACRLMHQAAVLTNFSEIVPCSLRGASVSKPLPDFQTLKRCKNTLSQSEVRVERKEPLVSDLPYLSFSGDPVYFEAFAQPIVDSLIATGATAMNMHFHVINGLKDAPDTTAMIDRLAALCHGAGYSLCVTSERRAGSDRTYFASARFLRAKELLNLFQHPILVSDMDTAFTKDPRSNLESYSRTKVTIMSSKGPYFGFLPWREFWAGHVLFPASQAGIDFADLLQRSIVYLWRDDINLTWWIDQYALWLAVRTMTAIGYGEFLSLLPRLDYMRSSEAFKIAGLQRVKAVAARMAEGDNWHVAVSTIQQDRASLLEGQA